MELSPTLPRVERSVPAPPTVGPSTTLWPGVWTPASAADSRLKRSLDVVLAALLLVATTPLMGLIALLVKATSRGPAIFRQPRIGYRCQVFEIYKFRTMVEGAECLEEELARRQAGRTFLKVLDDPRTTRIGRFLRRSSLDELPQLWNVLRGDMSLVGPRPILLSDFRKMPKRQQLRRFTVKPGITGLWQVSGRSRCSDEERMQLDLDYIRDWSHWTDLKILLRTVPAVLRAEGAG